MKGKIAKILGVGLVLALVAGLSLVPAIPVAASPDVSDVWVQLDDYTANTSTIYHVYFTPGADLAKNVDTITVFFPIDTVPTDAVTVTVDPDGDAVAATEDTATADVAGYRLEVTTPVDITVGNEVRLDIPSVTNPTTGDDYTLNVYTSQETTQVESSSYTIGASSVDTVGVDPTTGTAGAADEYTITFNEGILAELDVWDTVTVVFPTGTGIPSSIAPSAVTIDGETAPPDVPLDVAPVVDGRFVTLTVPEDWNPNTSATLITVVFKDTAGITNPTYAGSGYIGKVYTSDNLGIVSDTSGYTITAASVSQVAFDAVTSDAEVMVSTASDIRTAELIIQTKDQYGNLKNVPVDVVFDLSSSSGTGVFTSDSAGANVIEEKAILGSVNVATFYYQDTAVGTATITAENAAHSWSDTWDVEVTSETAVELWDGDTLVGEYTTITDAIGDALAGNVIKAGPGTYAEDINISTADLTLESTAGAATTTIEGGITISAADVTVDGFTMENTTTIMAISGADVTVKNNILTAETCVMGITLTGTGATISGNELDINTTMNVEASDCTLSDNTFGAGIDLVYDRSNITITGNTIIGSEYNGITLKSGSFTDILIEGNTISETTLGEGTGINVHTSAVNVTNLVIKGNDITDNEHIGILIENSGTWSPGNAIKFNTITGNADYGIENTTVIVDATHNWWGTTVASEIAGMVNDTGSGDTDYEPWLLATVSAGEFATGAVSLNAQATVGVRVSGAANAKICAARYTENPVATPDFIPLENGFFDVYVLDAGSPTEIGIKFYDAAITSDSVAYVWDAFEETWKLCTEQSAVSGMVWVKARPYDATVPAVPTIEDLSGTVFAISGAPAEFDPMVYDVDEDGVIDKSEAISAVQDYFDGVRTKEEAIAVVMLYFG